MNSYITISVHRFCVFHKIEPVFIMALHEQGLVNLVLQDDEYYILEQHLPKIEKYIQFHYDLGVNVEGLEVIEGLLERIERLQSQINQLNR